MRGHPAVQHIKSHLSARDARLETAVLVASLVVTWEGVEVCGHARRGSAEHPIATKALRCTATAWMLTAAESFAKL